MQKISFILLVLLLVSVPVLQAQDATTPTEGLPGQIDMNCSLVIGDEIVTEYCAPADSDVEVPDGAEADPAVWSCYTSDSGIQYCTLAGYTCYENGAGGRFCFEQETSFDATGSQQPAETGGQIEMRCATVESTEYCWPADSDLEAPDSAEADPDMWDCYTSDAGVQHCTLMGYTCYEDGEGNRFCFEQETMFDAPESRSNNISGCPGILPGISQQWVLNFWNDDYVTGKSCLSYYPNPNENNCQVVPGGLACNLFVPNPRWW